MDNNPDKVNQNPTIPPAPASPAPANPYDPTSPITAADDPVFSSTNLSSTKALSNAEYFTNVQKASLGQKISAWFAKVNNRSIERSKARSAALKAKREERRRAADLAAISAAIPDISKIQRPGVKRPAQPPQQPVGSTPAPQPSVAQVPVPQQPSAPAVAPQSNPVTPQPNLASAQPGPAPAAAQPTQLQTPQPVVPQATQPNITMPAPTQPSNPQQSKKPSKTTLILLALLLLLLIGAIIIIIVIRPWDSSAAQLKQNPPIISETGVTIKLKDGLSPAGNLDMATATSHDASTYLSAVLNSTTLDVYADSKDSSGSTSPEIVSRNIDQVLEINNITDPDARILFEIEKARVYMIAGYSGTFLEMMGQIDEDSLYDSQKGSYYYNMYKYYDEANRREPTTCNANKAKEYFDKYSAIPIFIGGPMPTTDEEVDIDVEEVEVEDPNDAT